MSRLYRSSVDGSRPSIPVITTDAERPGPSVAITANLHGDECTGIGVVFRLRKILMDHLKRGTVHLYSSLNPDGLIHGTREMPAVNADPNRAFPGRLNGNPLERHAWRIWQDLIARKPELVVDLHTDSGAAIPYAIVDRVVRGLDAASLFERCQHLAQASGLTVLREYPNDQYRRYRLDRSLPGALVNGPGVAAVTLEVGPRGYIQRDAVDVATKAALGVLTEIGVCKRPAPRHPTIRTGGPWRRASGPAISAPGIFLPSAAPGDTLKSGELIGTVRTTDGTIKQRLLAARDGFLVALPERAWVKPGQTCATIGIVDR
ncbi:MAG: succinylglutamate desuccinylase/aspartoacylase family protein [Myxococcota bacterium]